MISPFRILASQMMHTHISLAIKEYGECHFPRELCIDKTKDFAPKEEGAESKVGKQHSVPWSVKREETLYVFECSLKQRQHTQL